MSFVLSLLALVALTLIFLRERRIYIERHDQYVAEKQAAQEREVRSRLRVITGDVSAAPRHPPLFIVPTRDPDDPSPAA